MTTSYLGVSFPGILKVMSPQVGMCLPTVGRAEGRAGLSLELLSCFQKAVLLRG